MSIDDRLRATMAVHGASLTPIHDPLDAVTDGVRHSRRRALIIRLAVTFVSIVALAVAVPIVGAARSGPPLPAGVPWLDQPEELTGPPVTGRNTCQPGAYDVVERRGAGAGHYGLTVRNRSKTFCEFPFQPALESYGPNGAVIRVPVSETPESGRYTREPAVTLDPGQSATALIGVPTDCVGGGPPTTYADVHVVVGDFTIRLDDRITTTCGILVSTFNEDARDTMPTSLIPPWGGFVVAGIRTPSTATAGRPFDFRVAFRNALKTSRTLDLCPVYAMSLASAARGYRLNCAGLTVPAGGIQWFDMRVTVPADLPPGSYALTWWVPGEPTPQIAAVEVQP